MKRALWAIVLLSLSSGALGSEVPDRELAFRYLEASKMEAAVEASISEYEAQFVKKDATPEQRAKFHELFESTMGWAATKDQIASLVMKIYTRQELEASIAFMSTPAGASYAAKNGEFSRQWSSVISENLKKAASQSQGAAK